MDKTHWIQHVKNSLLKSGLPSRYVTRTCLELSDHVEESRDSDGEVLLLEESPEILSEQLVRSFRKQGFWRRIPPVLLLLLPLPVAFLATAAYFGLSHIFLMWAFDLKSIHGEIPLHLIITMLVFFYLGRMAIPLLSGLVACVITRRMARPWGWAAAFFVLQCWASALIRTKLLIASSPIGPASKEELTISIHSLLPHLEPAQLLSAIAIALLGVLVVPRLRAEQLQVE